MVRTMKGCPTTRLQSEGKDGPETILNATQQEGHPYATVEKDIADYNLDIDFEGSKPRVEPVAQEQREVPDRI